MTDFVAAESGIRQLHARFIDAVWRKDRKAFADCFTQDGEWKIATMHMRGRSEIGSGFARLLSTCERALILPAIPLVEVHGEAALGRIHFTEIAKLTDGTSAMRVAVYYDRYLEEEGRWRFRWRHLGLHYSGPVDLSATLVECPDYGPFPGLPGPDEPTFTRRKADT